MMRGIESRHEIDPTLLLRDTRTLTQRLADFFSDPTNIARCTFWRFQPQHFIFLKQQRFSWYLAFYFFSTVTLETETPFSAYLKSRG